MNSRPVSSSVPPPLSQRRVSFIQTSSRDFSSFASGDFQEFRNISLVEVLQDAIIVEYFREFVDKEFSLENLLFWEAVDKFQKLEGHERREQASLIINEFLVNGAPKEVNIPGRYRRAYLDPSFLEQESIPSNSFDEAQKYVFNYMQLDTFHRFLQEESTSVAIELLKKKKSRQRSQSVPEFPSNFFQDRRIAIKAQAILGIDPSKDKIMKILGLDEVEFEAARAEEIEKQEEKIRRMRQNWVNANSKLNQKAFKVLGSHPLKKAMKTIGIGEEDLEKEMKKLAKQDQKREKKEKKTWRKQPSVISSSEIGIVFAKTFGKDIQSLWSNWPSDVEAEESISPEPIFSSINRTENSFGSSISLQSVSTYPMDIKMNKRLGDPNADKIAIEVFGNRAILCLADGCGWGVHVAKAAMKANETFVQLMKKSFDSRSVREIATNILHAINEAHSEILEENNCGTTAFIGGELFPIKPKKIFSSKSRKGTIEPRRWIFTFASVGDCKAFRWSYRTKTVSDLTTSNRKFIEYPNDPGGRLGSETIDIRNLILNYELCEEGDIIILVSDGVHDNFHPKLRGFFPQEIDNTISKTWRELTLVAEDEIASQWRNKELAKIINESPTPASIVPKLIDHCVQLTRSSREFMENPENANRKLPSDYILYPGKLDHTSCIALSVGEPVQQKKNK